MQWQNNWFLKAGIFLLVWRLILGINVGWVAQSWQVRPDFEYTQASSEGPVIAGWWAFDGIHYAAIATQGYTDQARFLPVWPGVVWALNLLPGGGWRWGLVANVGLAALAGWLLYRLTRLDHPETTARQAVYWLWLFPTSFFLFAAYSESLFLCFVLGSLLAARSKQWGWAAGLAMIAAATRLPGILMLPVLMWEYWRQYGSWQKVLKSSSWLWLGIVPLALLVYAGYNSQKWGDWLYFVHAHGELANSRAVNGIVWPWQVGVRYVRILLSLSPRLYEWWVAAGELLVTICAATSLWIARRQIYPSYLLFAGLVLALPILSGTLTGLPRYVLAVFPVFMSLSLNINSKWQKPLLVISALLQICLLALFSRGYFVA
jgi:hypothetical protein